MQVVLRYLKRRTTAFQVPLNFRQCFLALLSFTLGYIYASLMNLGVKSGCHCNYPYEIGPRKAESNSAAVKKITADLVVVIFSSPQNWDKRNAIRATWLQTKGDGSIIHVFSIGSKDLFGEHATLLNEELEREKDLLLLPTVKDTYTSLSAKLLATMVWLHENAQFKFMFKADDDSFARLDILYHEAMKKPTSKLYWGFFDGRARVKKRGSWAEHHWNLCDRYLPYALGGGYVTSEDLVTYVAINSQNLVMYGSEDVSLGTWLAPLHLKRLHDLRFDTEYRSRGCSNMYIVTHKQTPEEMRDKYKNLKNHGILCVTETLQRKTYIYNWNVLPSQCCIRNISVISGHTT